MIGGVGGCKEAFEHLVFLMKAQLATVRLAPVSNKAFVRLPFIAISTLFCLRVVAKLIDLAPLNFEEFGVAKCLSLDFTPRTGASSYWNLPRFLRK